MASEFRVHHVSKDGLLINLPGSNGFGRVTRASFGGDALADKMFRHFIRQDSIPGLIATTTRDTTGYVEMSATLANVCTDLVLLDTRTAAFLDTQYRKFLLCRGGQVAVGKKLKGGADGTVLQLSNGMTCVTLESQEADESVDVHVRIIDFDHDANVVIGTQSPKAIETDCPTVGAFRAAVRDFDFGTRVKCDVLFVSVEYAVVLLPPSRGAEGRSIGFLMIPSKAEQSPAEAAIVSKLAVGQQVSAHVVFVPHVSMAAALPFVLVHLTTTGRQFAQLYAEHSTASWTPAATIAAELSWRKSKKGEKRLADEASREADEAGDNKMRRRQLEEQIDRLERDVERPPQSPDEFQKKLLASPNSSFLWTQFMAFFVDQRQTEDARNVAEKALTTIGVRETKELLNVWVAYLNLENLYGTAESLNSVFRRALQHSEDPYLVHLRLADIFSSSGKHQQLQSLLKTLCSKFKSKVEVWKRYGVYLVDQKKRELLKRMGREMANALSKNDQALVLEQVGVHEYKTGNADHARSMFEGLIAKYPKKTDVWSVYIDQERALITRGEKSGSADYLRALFDRVTSVQLAPKTMQQLLARYLAFEQEFGTEANVEAVKRRAREYVQSRIATL